MNKSVIIIGASGHGKVIADIVLLSGDTIQGFLDDNRGKTNFIGFPVLGACSDYERYPNAEFIFAIGNNKTRKAIAERMKDVSFYTAIHPSAVVSSIGTTIEFGTAIMPNAVVNAGTHIGRHCIVNSGAIVEHDNVIGDYTHIAVGAKLGGGVNIGKESWVGIGASIKHITNICDNVVIGAGATVVENITEPGIYIGTPARRIK